jgi:tRNA/tmRNA/rRNA uracil-C5-methylase (TrmA/RlmC/RlmD family)
MARWTNREIEIDIHGLHPDGSGCARFGERVVHCWGALPGERVLMTVRKRKRGTLFGLVSRVLKSSPLRREPLEAHYLSCSPWQVLEPAEEAGLKSRAAGEVFEAVGVRLPSSLEVAEGPERLGYRNKMEFSFAMDEDDSLSLAFFGRLSRRRLPVPGCVLARDEINRSAVHIVSRLRERGVPEASLKTLVVRADTSRRVLAAIFVKDKTLALDPAAMVAPPLAGLSVYYSEPRRPASVPTALLAHAGEHALLEAVSPPGGKPFSLQAGLMSFFQVNVPVFGMAVADMAPYLAGEDVVDYYAGVGAISLGAASTGQGPRRALLVEADPGAVAFARKNITSSGLGDTFEARESLSEKMRDIITEDHVVVFDPPRAGLHPRLLKSLQESPPRRIVYLSCNVSSQARDAAELMSAYRVAFARL